jgi:hypothetical protein
MVSVWALPHLETLSDHTPLLLTTGNPSPPRGRQFKFELGWLQRDVFLDMVKNVWEKPVVGRSPIQRWKKKLRSMRRFLGGWVRHMTGVLKHEKLCLSSKIDDLEAFAEVRPLTTQ